MNSQDIINRAKERIIQGKDGWFNATRNSNGVYDVKYGEHEIGQTTRDNLDEIGDAISSFERDYKEQQELNSITESLKNIDGVEIIEEKDGLFLPPWGV